MQGLLNTFFPGISYPGTLLAIQQTTPTYDKVVKYTYNNLVKTNYNNLVK